MKTLAELSKIYGNDEFEITSIGFPWYKDRDVYSGDDYYIHELNVIFKPVNRNAKVRKEIAWIEIRLSEYDCTEYKLKELIEYEIVGIMVYADSFPDEDLFYSRDGDEGDIGYIYINKQWD